MYCISAKRKSNIWDRSAKFQCVICASEDTRYAELQFLLCHFLSIAENGEISLD